jgi:hypothetical protein
MRAALNIIFGCLLLAMQAMGALAPHTISKATPCQCCSCGNQACSTPRTTPSPVPTPLAASRLLSPEAEKVSLPAQFVAKRAVSDRGRFLLPPTDVFLHPAVQPLYRQFCALLI